MNMLPFSRHPRYEMPQYILRRTRAAFFSCTKATITEKSSTPNNPLSLNI